MQKSKFRPAMPSNFLSQSTLLFSGSHLPESSESSSESLVSSLLREALDCLGREQLAARGPPPTPDPGILLRFLLLADPVN